MDIYRTYKFDFDEYSYTKEFAHALHESGIKKPAQFKQLLNDAGIEDYDYETIKSYYYGRRAAPLKVLIAVCKKLGLSADKLVYPQGVQDPAYNKDIAEDGWIFESVFYPCDLLSEDNGFTDFSVEEYFTDFCKNFSAKKYKESVYALAFVLSRYNYLIQKYHYAHVSDDEYSQIYAFTQRHIMDRKKDVESDAKKIIEWIRACNDEDFINAFYNKYTLCYYQNSACSLLELLSKLIGADSVNYAATLLPRQDRFEVKK